MSDGRFVTRRRFIQVSSSAAAAVSSGLLGGCAWRFQPAIALGADERRLVEAVADQIIPPDQDAGGKDAGIADFIDIQLRGPYRRFLRAYRDGLARLEETSRRVHQRSFLALSFDDQTALLGLLETGQPQPGIWKKGESAEFFRLICGHCMQGYYGSPRHGGNRRLVSWKMLRLDYPQVAGRVVV
jgi:gluconate 2-dehydrogenase gamma chain